MKKIFVLMMLFTLLVSGCGKSSGEKIVVGVDDEFPPMGFRDESGELVGFDIDLAKEVEKRMGVAFEFKPIIWNNKREEIESGNVDIIWNGLDITDERKEYMIFSKPYMDDRQIFLVKKGDDQNIRAEGDLEGKIIGVQAGSTAQTYFNEDEVLKKLLSGMKVYNKFNDGLAALERGDINVFICDESIARYEIHLRPDSFDIIDVTSGYLTEVAIGFRKNDTELRDRVQKVFDEMVKDGTAGKISEKWFQADLIKYPALNR